MSTKHTSMERYENKKANNSNRIASKTSTQTTQTSNYLTCTKLWRSGFVVLQVVQTSDRMQWRLKFTIKYRANNHHFEEFFYSNPFVSYSNKGKKRRTGGKKRGWAKRGRWCCRWCGTRSVKWSCFGNWLTVENLTVIFCFSVVYSEAITGLKRMWYMCFVHSTLFCLSFHSRVLAYIVVWHNQITVLALLTTLFHFCAENNKFPFVFIFVFVRWLFFRTARRQITPSVFLHPLIFYTAISLFLSSDGAYKQERKRFSSDEFFFGIWLCAQGCHFGNHTQRLLHVQVFNMQSDNNYQQIPKILQSGSRVAPTTNAPMSVHAPPSNTPATTPAAPTATSSNEARYQHIPPVKEQQRVQSMRILPSEVSSYPSLGFQEQSPYARMPSLKDQKPSLVAQRDMQHASNTGIAATSDLQGSTTQSRYQQFPSKSGSTTNIHKSPTTIPTPTATPTTPTNTAEPVPTPTPTPSSPAPVSTTNNFSNNSNSNSAPPTPVSPKTQNLRQIHASHRMSRMYAMLLCLLSCVVYCWLCRSLERVVFCDCCMLWAR